MVTGRRNWGVRWGEAIYRIEIVYQIIEAFIPYMQMKMNEEMLKHEQKYEDAEGASQLIKILCNQDVKPEKLMHTEDDIVNKILEHYEELKKALVHFPSVRYPYDKEDVMSVLAYLYHHNIWLRMKCFDYWLFISKVFDVFKTKRCPCTNGIKWLINESVEFCIWNGKIKHVDTAAFRHTFREIEDAFQMIVEKRKKRKKKK